MARGKGVPLRVLNGRHEAYCLLRVAGRNQTDAYLEAGYGCKSRDTARKEASKLERDPKIAARLAVLWAEKFKALHMDADEILARTAMIARSDVRSLFDDKGNMRPLHELTPEDAAAIAGVETLEEFEGTGKDRVKVGDVRKVRLRDPMPALRLLAEHKKLVKAPEEGLNALAGALAERLKAARERKRKESKP
jgi:phage terminase small subunit